MYEHGFLLSELLLFPLPNELGGEEIELALQGTGPAIFSDKVELRHSPEPTSRGQGNEGSRDSATPSRISSRRISI